MAHILVSGLLNVETSARIQGFPIDYFPIDYPFFGVKLSVSGVAFNLCSALTALGDPVRLASMTGPDLAGRLVRQELAARGVPDDNVLERLRETPASVVLHEESGRRQVYSDLKDIQETDYPFQPELLNGIQLVTACNIRFNYPLLTLAQEHGIPIATDVHVLQDPDDAYNRPFLSAAEILFLSDERIPGDYWTFLREIRSRYGTRILVLGMGAKGALLLEQDQEDPLYLPAHNIGGVVNTVGAGDALFASFLHYYMKGLPASEALDRAQLFAALKIRHSGGAAGHATEAEVEQYFPN